MRREIEEVVDIFKAKMEEKNWKIPQIVAAMNHKEKIHKATVYSTLGGYGSPSSRSIIIIGQALGVDQEVLDKAASLARQRKAPEVKKEPRDLDVIEQRLRRASNFLALAQKELDSVDNTIASALDGISDRLRFVSTMKNGLKFVK